MSYSPKDPDFEKIKLLVSESFPASWIIVSNVVNETDFHFELYTPADLFPVRKLIAEIDFTDHHQNIKTKVTNIGNKLKKELLDDGFIEIKRRLPQIPFSQEPKWPE